MNKHEQIINYFKSFDCFMSKTTSTIIHNSTTCTCTGVCEIEGKINIEGQILAMFLLF